MLTILYTVRDLLAALLEFSSRRRQLKVAAYIDVAMGSRYVVVTAVNPGERPVTIVRWGLKSSDEPNQSYSDIYPIQPFRKLEDSDHFTVSCNVTGTTPGSMKHPYESVWIEDTFANRYHAKILPTSYRKWWRFWDRKRPPMHVPGYYGE